MILWVMLFFHLTDFSPKNADFSKFNKILLIFPHPDDEVLTCGGLISILNTTGKKITDLILTKGEKGQEGAIYDPKLKKIRVKETAEVTRILGISKIIQDDFGDGELSNKKTEIEKRIREVITTEKPDLIITYDQSGLYGHPDHIAVSEIVTNILSVGAEHVQPYGAQHVVPLQNIKLWYVSFPQKFYNLTSLPTHMADNPDFMEKREILNLKFFTGLSTVKKIQALYAYKSQLFAFNKSKPKFIPLWFVLSARLFEYYHEA
jgi:LmbE family N-acetylglucosaminyl deacetylase